MMTFEKDPTAVLDYEIDWAGGPPGPWLATGETIVTSTWALPTGITSTSESSTGTTATIWLGACPAGTYLVTNTITTSAGRTNSRTLHIICTQR